MKIFWIYWVRNIKIEPQIFFKFFSKCLLEHVGSHIQLSLYFCWEAWLWGPQWEGDEEPQVRLVDLHCSLWCLCLVQGLKDLVWLPIEQYRKDGRIVRGFQRGAASFGTSPAMAALELTNRMVQTIQVLFPGLLHLDRWVPWIAAGLLFKQYHVWGCVKCWE